ncbi:MULTISPECIES: ROK family protein [unclassified Microbacterium]|uniref:ROK family protein n=1 Tax=unclassified Microbacterium TaxID=2609290 RepID=UPI0030104568
MSSGGVLGLDVGGSSVKFLLADGTVRERPEPILRGRRETPADDPVEGLRAIAEEVRGTGAEPTRIVVSIPGIVDEERGAVIRSTNVPALDDTLLAQELGARTGVPVTVINDGHAAAISEAAWGAGAGHEDVFVLALGTGIAGAHVVRGEVVPGAHGSAGELGHITIEPGGRVCSCGRRGCLETVIGAPALAEAWRAAGGSGGPEQLLGAYGEGSPEAASVVEHAAEGLAEAILTLCALVDPGCIVIGGGLAAEPHHLVSLARDAATARASFHRIPPIVPAALGGWAGAYGTVLRGLADARVALA